MEREYVQSTVNPAMPIAARVARSTGVKLEPSVPALAAPAAELPRVWRGRWLVMARVLWVATALLCAGLFVAGVPLQFAHLQDVRAQATCADGYVTRDQALCLATHSLSISSYAASSVGLLVVSMLIWSAVGLLI